MRDCLDFGHTLHARCPCTTLQSRSACPTFVNFEEQTAFLSDLALKVQRCLQLLPVLTLLKGLGILNKWEQPHNPSKYIDLDVGDRVALSDATDDFSGSPAKAQTRCAAKPHPVRSVCTPRLASRPARAVRPRGVHEIGLLYAVFVHLDSRDSQSSIRETVSPPKPVLSQRFPEKCRIPVLTDP